MSKVWRGSRDCALVDGVLDSAMQHPIGPTSSAEPPKFGTGAGIGRRLGIPAVVSAGPASSGFVRIQKVSVMALFAI
jgi:hypothetical protein